MNLVETVKKTLTSVLVPVMISIPYVGSTIERSLYSLIPNGEQVYNLNIKAAMNSFIEEGQNLIKKRGSLPEGERLQPEDYSEFDRKLKELQGVGDLDKVDEKTKELKDKCSEIYYGLTGRQVQRVADLYSKDKSPEGTSREIYVEKPGNKGKNIDFDEVGKHYPTWPVMLWTFPDLFGETDTNTTKESTQYKSPEYKAEQYAYFIIESLKEWLTEGVDDILFADRGANPLYVVTDYLIEHLEETGLEDLPDTGHFKFTSLEKLVDGLRKTGFDDEYKIEEEAVNRAKHAFVSKYGIKKKNRKAKVVDDWMNSGSTKDFTVELMQNLGYDFADKDFEVLVEGPGGGKARINPRMLTGKLPFDWRDVVEFHGRQLEIGTETGLDRIKEDYTKTDTGGKIRPKHLFQEFDIAKGPYKIRLERSQISKNPEKAYASIFDHLVQNYKVLNPLGTLPRDMDDESKKKIISLLHEHESIDTLYDMITPIVEKQYKTDIEEITEDIIISKIGSDKDRKELEINIEKTVDSYHKHKDIKILNTELGHIVVDRYQERLKRGVDIAIKKYGIEQLAQYIRGAKEQLVQDKIPKAA